MNYEFYIKNIYFEENDIHMSEFVEFGSLPAMIVFE